MSIQRPKKNKKIFHFYTSELLPVGYMIWDGNSRRILKVRRNRGSRRMGDGTEQYHYQMIAATDAEAEVYKIMES